MIFDTLNNHSRYHALHPGFAAAFAFAAACKTQLPPPGEYEIDGRKVYALVQHYDTQKPDQVGWEGHRRYIDIQCIIHGEEAIHFAPLGHELPGSSYLEELDLLRCSAEDAVSLPLREDQFLILYPEDLHRPKCQLHGSTPVDKLVIKVEI